MSCLRYQFILEFSGSWHSSDGSLQQWFPFWSNTYLAYSSRAARGPDERGSYSVCANSYIHVSWSVGPNERGQAIHLPVGHWVPSTASVMCWTPLTHFEWDFGVNIVLSVYVNKFFFTCLSFQCPHIPILSGRRQVVQTEARYEFSSSSPISAKPQLINQLDSTLLFRFKTKVKFSKRQPGSSVLCLLFTNLASGIWHHHFTAF